MVTTNIVEDMFKFVEIILFSYFNTLKVTKTGGV